jgi:hypothetical protein
MKDDEKIPWIQILGFLLLLFLGMILPFWMEYKSRTDPLPKRASEKSHKQTLEDRNAQYCPACGAKISIPYWRTESTRPDNPTTPLTLKTLGAPSWTPREDGAQPPSTSTMRSSISPD